MNTSKLELFLNLKKFLWYFFTANNKFYNLLFSSTNFQTIKNQQQNLTSTADYTFQTINRHNNSFFTKCCPIFCDPNTHNRSSAFNKKLGLKFKIGSIPRSIPIKYALQLDLIPESRILQPANEEPFFYCNGISK